MMRRTHTLVVAAALTCAACSVARAQSELIKGYGDAQKLLGDRKPSGGSGGGSNRESPREPRERSGASESRGPSQRELRKQARAEERRQAEAVRQAEAAAQRAEEQRITDNLLIIDNALAAARATYEAPEISGQQVATGSAEAREIELTTVLNAASATNNAVAISGPTALTGVIAEGMMRELVRNERLRERHDAISADTPLRIDIKESATAKADPRPWYYRANEELVSRTSVAIDEAAAKHHVDADLIRAVMWMETTHGWYDKAHPRPSSLRPMNINPEAWAGLGFTRADLEDPSKNVEAGTILLKRLWEHTEQPSVEKVATLYNNLAALAVNDYGKTVDYYYRNKPWQRSDR